LDFELNADGNENPEFTLTQNGRALIADKDYTVSYKISEDGLHGVLTIEGKGNYEGIITQAYDIEKFDHLVWIIPVAFVSVLGIGALTVLLIRRKRKKSKATDIAE
jgi:hypothetical protein